MTAIPGFVDISAGHAVPKDVEGHALIGLRETLGAVYVDPDFPGQFAEATRRNPAIVTLGYVFLTGPLRGPTVDQQVAYWAQHHQCDLGALDWERDTYKDHEGAIHDLGIQTFASVLRGLDVAREHGIDAGAYMSRYLASPEVVKALLDRNTPFLWIAAYGLAIPDWTVAACRKAGALLFHQYAGDTIDRNRVLVGTLEELHALAGRAAMPASGDAHPGGDAVKFIQLSSADLPALPTVEVPTGTPIEDFAGEQWDTIDAATHLRVLPGLVDAHTNRRAVVISTGRFYADRQPRPTVQVAVLKGG